MGGSFEISKQRVIGEERLGVVKYKSLARLTQSRRSYHGGTEDTEKGKRRN
jgi:hypothetical protein